MFQIFNSSYFFPSATPSIRELMSISVGHLNMIQSVGTRYPTLGIFLLQDDNGVLVEALTLEHQHNKRSHVPSSRGELVVLEGNPKHGIH